MKKLARLLPFLLLIACGKSSAPLSGPKVEDVPVQVEATGEVDPIASTDAVPGGSFTSWPGDYPKSLNMWLEYNSFSVFVSSLMFEPLLELHSTENRPVGDLAQSWEVSPDKMTYTFHLNPAAKWSDGTPVTATDVQYYYDVIMNPKNLTSLFRVDMSRFSRPVVLDDHTVRITANKPHWANFWVAGGMVAFPKHAWEGRDFNTINFDFPVVDGPYALDKAETNHLIRLKRRGDWWGRVQRYNEHKFNFDYLVFKATSDQVKALEMLKKEDFDAYSIYTARIWSQQSDFDQVQKNWILKQNIFNDHPKAFQGLALNMRRPIFQDVRVRQALSCLLDRQTMNDKLMFDNYFLLNSYYPDLYPNNRNPDVPLITYDPDKARALLKDAGWQVGGDGILVKDGQPFDIAILNPVTPDVRHLTLYVEDLKSVGINAHIEPVSFATFTKRVDNYQFDIVWENFDATRLRDPESMWSSKVADDIAGQNFPGVRDPDIDKLIDAQKTEMDLDKRNAIDKQIDARLVALNPYVLMWQSASERLLYWNRYGTPKYILSRFSDNGYEWDPLEYWWFDAAKSAALDDAMKRNVALPPVPAEVHYGQ